MPIAANNNEFYRVPRDLSATSRPINRWLVIGSCLASGFTKFVASLEDGAEGDYILFNNGTVLPPSPPHPIDLYDCQLIQLPVRSILPDLAHARLDYNDIAGFKALFDECATRMEFLLNMASVYAKSGNLTTFVLSLAIPQQGSMGRVVARRDIRNLSYFIQQLNERLCDLIEAEANFYLVDTNDILRTYGAKYFQDDVLWQYNHAAALTDNDHAQDQERMQVPAPPSEHYTLRTTDVVRAIWEDLRAQYTTIKRLNAVKLVIFDIDDTLWRGVVAERDLPDPAILEGWPLGVAEAALYLKQRGIVIAIVSKNSEERVRTVWNSMWGGRLRLEDFASIKINWNSKVANVAEVISEVNVLPDSVVFVDDNPVERHAIEISFPGIRTIGADLYYIRRILLWSPETQPAVMTGESAQRNSMVKAQIIRENTRKSMDRSAFLDSLAIRFQEINVASVDHPNYPRIFELLNKTNQFNTTGKRWTTEEIQRAFADGLEIFAFKVTDKFTEYGLVGAALVRQGVILQFVMSCRVIGLDVELLCLESIKRRNAHLLGRYVPNEKNGLCADLFERAGFVATSDGWEWDSIL